MNLVIRVEMTDTNIGEACQSAFSFCRANKCNVVFKFKGYDIPVYNADMRWEDAYERVSDSIIEEKFNEVEQTYARR